MRLLTEIRRRGVLTVATAYLAVGWLTLEVGATLFNIFDLPTGGLRLIFALLAIGFPLVLLGTWQGWFRAMLPVVKAGASVDATEDAEKPYEGRLIAVVFGAVALLAIAIAIGMRFFGMGHPVVPSGVQQAAVVPQASPAAVVAEQAKPAAFAPPAHSVAVLPFVNMSGDPGQDYFSDGLSEELLNSLARIARLQVAARTSSFSFKGKELEIGDIARKLNVGAILEGSVRKDGTRVRITAQLIDAVTGFHLWSDTYDHELRDILKLQTDIAGAVTSKLQATLLGSEAARFNLGGTTVPKALDAYLKARQFGVTMKGKERYDARVVAYSEAISADPQFASAYAARSLVLAELAGAFDSGVQIRTRFAAARADAEKAIALAPDLGEGHSALASVLDVGYGQYKRAAQEYARSVELAPGNAEILRASALFQAYVGAFPSALAVMQRVLMLDPLTSTTYRYHGAVLQMARHYRESVSAYDRAIALSPGTPQLATSRGRSLLALGEFEAARQSCTLPPVDWSNQHCLAVVFHRMHRQPEAQAMLKQMKSEYGDDTAYQYAGIYAQWGQIPQALDWLETALRMRDPGLIGLKTDEYFDPLRNEPRYLEVERKLDFPD